MPYEAYLDFLDDETVLNYIDIARKNEEFWKLEKRIINKIIAFYIIKKEQNTELIHASIVDEKYKKWNYSFTN
ncbi:MAG: hypothetical protein IKI94_09965 [Ruminococcus sp.]|nr:hypothetical protein [Ruminococcus sp.]